MNRRRALATLGVVTGARTAWAAEVPRDATPIRIGFSLSATGPFAIGASITQRPNYQMWADQVNERGGLVVEGKVRRPVAFVEYDDESDPRRAVALYEKLIAEERVDLVLAPWGTSISFAVAEVTQKHGYPLLAPTAISDRIKRLHLPLLYCVLPSRPQLAAALGDLVGDLHEKRKIERASLAYVDDAFGLALHTLTRKRLEESKVPIAAVQSYRLGEMDLRPLLRKCQTSGSDAFIALSYPIDSALLAKQAKDVGYQPKLFMTGVGTAYPRFRDDLSGAEGIMGIAGWNPKVNAPGARAYFDDHRRRFGAEPDRYASAFAYGALQILERCVASVGLDRKRLANMLDQTTFDTVAGPIRFAGGSNISTPGMVGQWQKGEFEIVWPSARATASTNVPKVPWG